MRYLLTLLLLTAVAFGCKRDNEPKKPKENQALELAKDRRVLYCELSKPIYDAQGFVGSKCDGLTFTALYAIACPENEVDIETFEYENEPGRWSRDPGETCGPENGSSRSTMSSDGLLMLSIWAVKNKRRDVIQRTVAYLDKTDGKIGDCRDDAKDICSIWPTLRKTMEKYLEAGDLVASKTDLSEFPWSGVKGFRAHLLVNHIHLNGLVYGAINGLELDAIKSQASRQPENGIYEALKSLYTDGNQARAIELSTKPKHFPSDQLPNNHEHHCSDYIFQRDEDNKDWVPCPDKELETHPAVDSVYALSISVGL